MRAFLLLIYFEQVKRKVLNGKALRYKFYFWQQYLQIQGTISQVFLFVKPAIASHKLNIPKAAFQKICCW